MIRLASRTLQAFIDLLALALAFWLAFAIRFDGALPEQFFKQFVLLVPYVVVLEYTVLMIARVPRFAWRYVGLHEISRILMAIVASTVILLAGRFIASNLLGARGYARFGVIPLGVLLINFLLAFSAVTSLRVVRRLLGETRSTILLKRTKGGRRIPTILIGAGQAGVMVAREIGSRPDLGIEPLGFLDDDRNKIGTVIHRLPVLGTSADLSAVAARLGAEQVLITIANATGEQIRNIARLCERANLPAKIIPGVYEIVTGRVNITRIRDIALEDLLGRAQVHLDEHAIAGVVRDRVVMVTGAGGSIGSELCRQIVRFSPARLLLVDQAENNLFTIHKELCDSGVNSCMEVVPCIADICDLPRMESIFQSHRPHVVLHAAAHKHVPMMEWNPGEAIKNNIQGTRGLADLAHQYQAASFVMISTDKAVNPSSVMGVTKRVAELYIQALARRSKTRFVTVRFGNVLGSTGSVVPIFQKQIAEGGPVLVTHPEMKRYFMTIPEACQLVLQAATMGVGGEIFILDMGEPIKIVDLAKDLIVLSGLRPELDIPIKYIGIRPGEKLFEELSTSEEHADKTLHPKIFIGRFTPPPWETILAGVVRLCDGALRMEDSDELRSLLGQVVPEYAMTTVEGVGASQVLEQVKPDRQPEIQIPAQPKTQAQSLLQSQAQAQSKIQS